LNIEQIVAMDRFGGRMRRRAAGNEVGPAPRASPQRVADHDDAVVLEVGRPIGALLERRERGVFDHEG